MKPDEKRFLEIMQRECWCSSADGLTPRKIITRESGWLNEKRAHYILGKWCDKDWYNYGVCIDLGWMTEKGLDAK